MHLLAPYSKHVATNQVQHSFDPGQLQAGMFKSDIGKAPGMDSGCWHSSRECWEKGKEGACQLVCALCKLDFTGVAAH